MGADVEAQEKLGLLHQPAGGAVHGIVGGGPVGQMVAIISHHIPCSNHRQPDWQATGHVFGHLLGSFSKLGSQLLFIVPAWTHRREARFSRTDGQDEGQQEWYAHHTWMQQMSHLLHNE